MMNKPESWKITAWALGELEGPEADEVAAAMAADPEVADEVEAVMASAIYAEQELAKLPRWAPVEAKPERTSTGPVAAVTALAPKRGRRERPVWRWLAAAAVTLAAAVALILALNADDEVVPPTSTPLAVVPEARDVALGPVTGGGPAGEQRPEAVSASPAPPALLESGEPEGEARVAAHPGEEATAQAGDPEPTTLVLTVIVDPPTATLLASKGRIEARGNGLYEVRDLVVGDAVKLRVEREDGDGVSREVVVAESRPPVRIAVGGGGDTPPAPTSAPGEVKVNARPWAKVSVDGRAVGTTPLVLQLPPGEHTLELSRAGDSETRRVTVTAGARVSVFHDFVGETPDSTTGRKGKMRLHARPWAQIAIDGRPIGTTPKTIELAPGRYEVTLTKGATKATKTVTVRAGETAVVTHDFAASPF